VYRLRNFEKLTVRFRISPISNTTCLGYNK
jgi:hypothetical protein